MGFAPRPTNSSDTTNGDEKYCLAADDAIERTWCDDPALPGMNKTGRPIAYLIQEQPISHRRVQIHPSDITWLGSHPTSRYSQSEYRLASGVHEVLNSDWSR